MLTNQGPLPAWHTNCTNKRYIGAFLRKSQQNERNSMTKRSLFPLRFGASLKPTDTTRSEVVPPNSESDEHGPSLNAFTVLPLRESLFLELQPFFGRLPGCSLHSNDTAPVEEQTTYKKYCE